MSNRPGGKSFSVGVRERKVEIRPEIVLQLGTKTGFHFRRLQRSYIFCPKGPLITHMEAYGSAPPGSSEPMAVPRECRQGMTVT